MLLNPEPCFSTHLAQSFHGAVNADGTPGLRHSGAASMPRLRTRDTDPFDANHENTCRVVQSFEVEAFFRLQ